MAITPSDFSKIWASTSSVPEYTFSDSDYQDGWEFVGNLPPTRAMWDTLQRRNDEKMQYLMDLGIVNVKHYGATGDGTTDDSDAVNDAIQTGKAVYFPEGTYLVVGITDFVNGSVLYGEGTIKQKSTDSNTPAITATNINGLIIDGLTFESQNIIYNTRTNGAFLFDGCENVEIKNVNVISTADRNFVFNGCDGVVFSDYVAEGNGTVVTITDTNNADVFNGNITGNVSSTYHLNDVYATSNNIPKNIEIHDIHGHDHGSNVLQVTADQSTGAGYENLHVHNIVANNCSLVVKFDGADAFFDRVCAENCAYGISAAGTSTSADVDVFVKNCRFKNISIGASNFTVVTSDTHTRKLVLIGNVFENCERICSDAIQNLTIKNNFITSANATACTFGKSGTHPITIIMDGNVIDGAYTSIRYPNNAEKMIVKNNTIKCAISSGSVTTFNASAVLHYSGNSYAVTNIPSTFRIKKPAWYDTTPVEATIVCHYGNNVNGTLMTINGSDNTTYTENTYTIKT